MIAHKRLTKLLLPAVTAIVAVGASACSPDFDPYNRLTALRILGVKSEVMDAAPGTGQHAANAAPGQVAKWEALVYTLPDDPAPTYEWSWCPFMGAANTGYACTLPDGTPVSDALLSTLMSSTGMAVPALSLGQEATAQLPNFADPATLGALCAGMSGVPGIPPFDCSGGFPYQIKVQVTTGGSHPDTVVAVAKGHWLLGANMASNANPNIQMLTATQGGAEMLLTDDASLTFPRDRPTPIHADVHETEAEMYMGVSDDGQTAMLTERLFVTWFVESGNTDDSRTSYYPNGTTPIENLQKNTWTPAPKKDYPADTARIFVVVHDNRGGVSWLPGTVNLTDPTP